ncbi:hypothetical protein, partial [Companilactobacillus sp.]|uniref:hypothetical protein n=1 Tax=Companilactobacillus sp. TaxID=2767905 RepID=UPI00262772A4
MKKYFIGSKNIATKQNNLRLVLSKDLNLYLELFLYTEDKAMTVHTLMDFVSALKNGLRYLH